MRILDRDIAVFTGRRAEMRPSNLETSVIGQFLATLKDRGTELPYPQSIKPVLYLKCWGSDYPYLQGGEMQKRWLPVPVGARPNL